MRLNKHQIVSNMVLKTPKCKTCCDHLTISINLNLFLFDTLGEYKPEKNEKIQSAVFPVTHVMGKQCVYPLPSSSFPILTTQDRFQTVLVS